MSFQDARQPLLGSQLSSLGSPRSVSESAPASVTPRNSFAAESWKRKYLRTSTPGSLFVNGLATNNEEGSEAGLSHFEAISWHSDSNNNWANESVEKYLYMAGWLGFLLLNYCCARALSYWGLPSDGVKDLDPYDLIDDLSKLFLFGFVLGWFVRITQYDRFMWLFSRRQLYFPAAFFFTPPLYSLLSELPALKHSLADISNWGPGMWAMEATVLCIVVSVIGCHVREALKLKGWIEFMMYFCSRAVIFAFFGVAVAVVIHDDHYSLHLHHLYIGWGVALFAEFNSALSAVTLAIATGIFIQGIGAYSFANNVYNPHCFHLHAVGTDPLICNFTSLTPNFSLTACPTSPLETITGKCYH